MSILGCEEQNKLFLLNGNRGTLNNIFCMKLFIFIAYIQENFGR